MNWTPLEDIAQLETIKTESISQPVLIFKHSTRCNISAMVLGRLDKFKDSGQFNRAYFLDLLQHRDISHRVAEFFQVYHESPQALIIKNGECVYDASHMDIRGDELLEYFKAS